MKGRKIGGYKFRRQHGIGNYIVDVYCLELDLIIEVDGESHYTFAGKSHDQKRTNFLKNFDLTIIRFTNDQVTTNLGGVITKIKKVTATLDTDH